MARLSAELEDRFLSDRCPERISLDDILKLAGERTFGFLFVLLSLPSALPLPAPGYSTPFGVVIALLAAQMLVGARKPWLPGRWRSRQIDRDSVQKLLRAGLPWLRRIEAIARPRLTTVCTSLPGRIWLGLAIFLMGCSMIAPIPGTNTLPAAGIWLTGFGLTDDDGAISLFGSVMGLLVTAAIWTAIWFGGASLTDWIRSLLAS